MKMNKKGFTIVELVIVIAVIAILAGVMIPTFGGVIDNAKKTSAQQEATNVYKQMCADIDNIGLGTEFTEETFYIVIDNYIFVVDAGEIKDAPDNITADGLKGDSYAVTTDEKFGTYAGATVYYAK